MVQSVVQFFSRFFSPMLGPVFRSRFFVGPVRDPNVLVRSMFWSLSPDLFSSTLSGPIFFDPVRGPGSGF